MSQKLLDSNRDRLARNRVLPAAEIREIGVHAVVQMYEPLLQELHKREGHPDAFAHRSQIEKGPLRHREGVRDHLAVAVCFEENNASVLDDGHHRTREQAFGDTPFDDAVDLLEHRPIHPAALRSYSLQLNPGIVSLTPSPSPERPEGAAEEGQSHYKQNFSSHKLRFSMSGRFRYFPAKFSAFLFTERVIPVADGPDPEAQRGMGIGQIYMTFIFSVRDAIMYTASAPAVVIRCTPDRPRRR